MAEDRAFADWVDERAVIDNRVERLLERDRPGEGRIGTVPLEELEPALERRRVTARAGAREGANIRQAPGEPEGSVLQTTGLAIRLVIEVPAPLRRRQVPGQAAASGVDQVAGPEGKDARVAALAA